MIVGIQNGPFGRVVEDTPEGLTLDTTSGPMAGIQTDQLKAGVCKYCGKDCKTAGGKGTHEKACAKKYYPEE